MPSKRELPLPQLEQRCLGEHALPLLVDARLAQERGIIVAFSTRAGGVSRAPFDSLNLGDHVNDDAEAVAANRSLLLQSLGIADTPLVVPRQVHGTQILELTTTNSAELEHIHEQAAAGADAVVIRCCGAAALLCFADCLPLIIVSPPGAFAVVHAGWRGALAGIAGDAARLLSRGLREEAAHLSAYIGPHICSNCFEVDSDLAERFADRFGSVVLADSTHVSLSATVRQNLLEVGMDTQHILDVGECTCCQHTRYFSYRASDGNCGRQGALAWRARDKEEIPWV